LQVLPEEVPDTLAEDLMLSVKQVKKKKKKKKKTIKKKQRPHCCTQ
jgi:hypothetical protein